MDVSGWTMAERLMLPDWCFPNRQIISLYIFNNAAGTFNWGISVRDLPNPAMIWRTIVNARPQNVGTGQVRFGLAHNVPVNQAQMDGAAEIYPDLGKTNPGPDMWPFMTGLDSEVVIESRMGMVTNGMNLVAELNCIAGWMRTIVYVVVSGLPTAAPGFCRRTIP